MLIVWRHQWSPWACLNCVWMGTEIRRVIVIVNSKFLKHHYTALKSQNAVTRKTNILQKVDLKVYYKNLRIYLFNPKTIYTIKCIKLWVFYCWNKFFLILVIFDQNTQKSFVLRFGFAWNSHFHGNSTSQTHYCVWAYQFYSAWNGNKDCTL